MNSELTSAISEWEVGVQPASPIPTPTRAQTSWTKFWAWPQRTVKPLR